jgi:hypothetical protein
MCGPRSPTQRKERLRPRLKPKRDTAEDCLKKLPLTSLFGPMHTSFLLHIFSESAPDCPKLYLDRSEGTAVFAARRSEVRDEVLARLPGETGTPFKVEGRDGVVFVVVAPISRVGRALRALGWGQDHVQAPQQPAPRPAPRRPPQRRPPQRRPSGACPEETEPKETEPKETESKETRSEGAKQERREQ